MYHPTRITVTAIAAPVRTAGARRFWLLWPRLQDTLGTMSYELSPATLRAAQAAAVAAAEAAGAVMLTCYARRRDAAFELDVDTKSSVVDMVTQYDKQCEELILASLAKFRAPVTAGGAADEEFSVVSEETASDAPLTDRPTWVVDPIDGTTSFIHGSFDCGVSIGLTVNQQSVMGVVLLPSMGELFTAIAGLGAFCNGRPIRVSGCTAPERSIVCTHCPYNRSAAAIGALSAINTELLCEKKVHAVRAYGSAAMDMCSVAMGRLDLYFEVGIQSWDMAAAAVIVREAGGALVDVEGGAFDLTRRGMACGGSAAMAEMGVAIAVKHNYRAAILGE
jgi:fructose-1,6-bisphosphatase/inositol monophosphatase family enzyme